VVHKATNGIIAVRATTGTRIADASDVEYAGASDNSFLVYNSATGVWEDEAVSIFKTIAVAGQSSVVADTYTDTLTLAAGTNVSITTDANTDTITINSTDEFVGTVTSVAALTLGTTGTDLSSTVVNSTTTPVITLNVPTASATNRGALSSADWTTFNSKEPALTKGNLTEATSSVLTITGGTNAVIGTGTTIQVAQAGASSSGYLSSTDWTTFNGKQDAITLTTTGTSGAATLVGSTLNIPDYTEQYAGTVTSVATTAPITGGTITDTGTIGITQSGAASDGYLSSADWTTFNGKQNAITLTTTGTTGAATLIGATLNIPNYADQFVGTVTSVDMSVPTGFAISGNPITTSGTLAVAFAAGYSLPTDASQATWNTAYNDSITAFAYNTSTGALTLTQQDAGTLTATVTLQPFSTTNLVEGTNLYYTDTRARLALSAGTGISYDNATGVITNSSLSSGGTVTSVAALTLGTTGTDLSSTVADGTTTPVITLQVPTASATNRGALSSADWTTFNGKQSAITLTTTGSTGAATFISNTLNIPNYTDQFVGTVTSVATTAPITGGTFTTTGTIGITKSGASADGYLSSTDWNTFNNKQNALTNPVTGTGTTNYVAKFTAGSIIGDSQIFDNGTNVGINNNSPSYRLDVAGDTHITSGSLGVGVAPNATDGRIDASNDIVAFQTSDRRLKKNITPITNALEKVKSLTGVMFDWKEETKSVHGYEGHDVGIIAQDVQAVLPEAVRTNDTGYLSVRYEKMIALLIEGMKEQQLQIDELKSKLK
jgi:hypothetical protein